MQDLDYFVVKDLLAIRQGFPAATLPKEWLDVLRLDGGNGKHKPGSWAEPEGATMSWRDNHSAMFRHLAESFAGNRIDPGTQQDHLLSVAFRALAAYARIQRDIQHPDD